VLLVSVDSLRADRLGVYGSGRETSPTLDRLAREGVLFEQALSPTAWTLPSHVTLLSGDLPHHHGTVARSDTIRPDLPLLQESFARHGYETIGFYSGPFLHPFYGFARGFEQYRSCETKPVTHPYLLEEVAPSHHDRTNRGIRDAFSAWVAKKSKRPFFVFVHMWDVHFDYIAPEPWASMFDPDYTGVLNGRDIAGAGFPDAASRRDVDHLLALYDGEVRYTDATIAELLRVLDSAGLLDDTLVVVTSDHGEEFLEHGGKTHHRTVYMESVHVPLIVWARSGLARGHRVTPFVSLADIAPTILDVVGLPPLGNIDGRTLAPALHGDVVAPRPVASAMFIPGDEWRRTLAIREGDRSLVLWKKRDQWMGFDLADDPGEQWPQILGGEERELLARYDAEIMALVASREAAPKPAAGGLPRDIDAKLRALGYVD
jgi:arylsulfatase A-like enzyme